MSVVDGLHADKKRFTDCTSLRGGRFDNLENFKDTEQNVQTTYTAVTEHNSSQRMPGYNAIIHCGAHDTFQYTKRFLLNKWPSYIEIHLCSPINEELILSIPFFIRTMLFRICILYKNFLILFEG